MKWTLWVGVVGIALTGCSDHADKTVAGRTRSSAVLTPGMEEGVGTLELRRTLEAATGLEQTSVFAHLEAKVESGVLRFPNGSEVDLERDGEAWFVESAPPEGVGAGAYTLYWRNPNGAYHTLGFALDGAFPPYPAILEPTDMSLVVEEEFAVRWRWPGTAGLFELELADTFSGEVLTSLVDLPNAPLALPTPETPSRFVLTVRAVSAPSSAHARWVSATTVQFDGGRP